MRLWTVNSAVFIRLAGSFSIIRVCGGAAMRMGGLGRLGRHSLTRGVYPFRSAAAQSAGPRIMTAMTLVEMAGGDFNGWFRVSGMLEPDERENQEAYNGKRNTGGADSMAMKLQQLETKDGAFRQGGRKQLGTEQFRGENSFHHCTRRSLPHWRGLRGWKPRMPNDSGPELSFSWPVWLRLLRSAVFPAALGCDATLGPSAWAVRFVALPFVRYCQ